MRRLNKGMPLKDRVKKLSRRVLRWTLLFLVIFPMLWIVNQYPWTHYYPIRTVHVHRIQYTSPDEVKMLVLPIASRGYFGVNIDEIHAQLYQLAWISESVVKRHWPDRLDVDLYEHQPLARWNENAVITDRGFVILPNPKTIPDNLPLLKGPQSEVSRVFNYYYSVNEVLSPLNLKLASFELTPYETWKLVLNNGLHIEARSEDILTRLTHFVKVYPKIVGSHENEVDYIDLRYANGLAIRWKAGVKPA